jgi:hypothetical protein
MKKSLSLNEALLLLGVLVLCVLAIPTKAPQVAQSSAYHQFADARTLLGIPHALDSLSNIGFLIFGIYGLGLARLGRLELFSASFKASVLTFFIGFVATAAGSAYYHLAPDNPGLVVDRLGMVIVFAGMLGMGAAQRVSERGGWTMLGFGLIAGPASVLYWSASGSILPYAVMQAGGITLTCLMLSGAKRGPGPCWWVMVLSYGLAKVCESHDAQIFELTGQLLSGHTVKHLLAALPILAITEALKRKPA